MPVHEVRYRTFDGDALPRWRALIAIPNFTFASIFNKPLAVALFGFGGLQLLGYTAYLQLLGNPLLRKTFEMTMFIEILPEEIFRRFFLLQMYVCLVVAMIAAPRMISPERAHRALSLVYARPLSRAHYVFGKLLSLLGMLGFLTVIQATILFFVMIVSYPATHEFQLDFWTVSFPLYLKAIVHGSLMTVVISAVALATSAATINTRYSTLIFISLVFGSTLLTRVLQEATNTDGIQFGIREVLQGAGEQLFAPQEGARVMRFLNDENTITGTQPLGARFGGGIKLEVLYVVGVIALWLGGALGFMIWRLRPVDVYKE